MSLCDRVEVHFTNITRNKKQRNDDVYIVPEALESDRDTVFFSWLVSSNATQLIGSLKFSNWSHRSGSSERRSRYRKVFHL